MRAPLATLAALAAAAVLAAAPAHAAPGDINTFAGTGVDGQGGDGGPATSAGLRNPGGIAIGPGGDVFIADAGGHKIRRVTPGGTISTYAGVGLAGFSGDGGQATLARFNTPTDVAVDALGNVYVADSFNSRVRRISPDGTITTFAGTGSSGHSGDGGAATSAQLHTPRGLAVDPLNGDLYIADPGNHTVRRVTSGGTIRAEVGTGTAGDDGDGGFALFARIDQPEDVAFDAGGNFYIADGQRHKVRRVAGVWDIISTVAGNGLSGYTGNGGAATSARLGRPKGVAIDSAGNLFISERDNHVVRRVAPGGTIAPVVATASAGYGGDGGAALSAQVNQPERIALAPDGDLYIADFTNRRVRVVDDLGAPAPPALSSTSPTSPGNANTVAVRGSAVSGTTVRLYTNSTCTSSVAATGTDAELAGAGISVTVASDSATTFWATATNSSGSTSGCSTTSVQYVEDSTPPASPTFSQEPASPASETMPAWEFSAEAGTSVDCRLDLGGTPIDGWTDCASGSKSYDLSGELDGVYTITVRASDAAGNSATATSGYTLDRGVPSIPAITSAPPPAGSGRSPEWSFTAGSGTDTLECRLVGGTLPGGWAACTSPQSYSLTGQPDDTYTFSVRARSVGGVYSVPRTDDYALDTASPAAPSIDAAPPAAGSGRSPSWSFSAEAGATFECRLVGGSLPGTWGACSSGDSWSLTGQPDGDYIFSVRARDAALNVSSTTDSVYELDTTDPAAPVAGDQPASPSSSRTPSWSFSGGAGDSFACRLERAGEVVSDWAACASPHALDLTGRPDGTYELLVRATDPAGNTGPSRVMGYELDTQPGTLQFTSVPPALASDRAPHWGFVGEPGASFECRLLREGAALGGWSGCTSPYGAALLLEPDARYRLEVRAIDRAGNLGAPIGADYVLDTTAPAAATLTGDPGAIGRTRSPSWSFSGEGGSAFECRLERSGAALFDWDSCASPHRYSLAERPDGGYRFLVRAFDEAGNRAEPRAHEYELDTTDPDPPALRSAPGERGDDLTPTWAFSAERDATTECRLERGDSAVFKWEACKSPHTYSLVGEGDARYRFGVRATDAAGNTGKARGDDYELVTATQRGGGDAPAANAPAAAPPAGPAPTPGPGLPSDVAPADTPGDEGPPGDGAGKGEGGVDGLNGDGAAPGSSGPPLPGFLGGDGSGGGDGGSGREEEKRGATAVVTKALGQAVKAVAENADKSVFPMSLVFIVAGFLLIQGRIDRNDPKLALAPVFADPELEFLPPPSKS